MEELNIVEIMAMYLYYINGFDANINECARKLAGIESYGNIAFAFFKVFKYG